MYLRYVLRQPSPGGGSRTVQSKVLCRSVPVVGRRQETAPEGILRLGGNDAGRADVPVHRTAHHQEVAGQPADLTNHVGPLGRFPTQRMCPDRHHLACRCAHRLRLHWGHRGSHQGFAFGG